MERFSILIDKRQIDLEEGYNMKTPTLLCEYCAINTLHRTILEMSYGSETFRKSHYLQCSKCPTPCNRLDNIRRHIRKHPGQTNTPKTVMYEIKEMSPEPELPRR